MQWYRNGFIRNLPQYFDDPPQIVLNSINISGEDMTENFIEARSEVD